MRFNFLFLSIFFFSHSFIYSLFQTTTKFIPSLPSLFPTSFFPPRRWIVSPIIPRLLRIDIIFFFFCQILIFNRIINSASHRASCRLWLAGSSLRSRGGFLPLALFRLLAECRSPPTPPFFLPPFSFFLSFFLCVHLYISVSLFLIARSLRTTRVTNP